MMYTPLCMKIQRKWYQLYYVACSVTGVIARKRLEAGQVVQARRPLLAVVPLHRL
jgi:multidrug resistance efflux pump